MVSDQKWVAGTIGVVVISAVAPFALLAALGILDTTDDKQLAAVLALVGVAITACASLIATQVRRQSEQRLERQHGAEEARLRLDAAMRAGALFNSSGDAPAAPAAMASGLLALTELGRSDLAVALLVDLWDRKADASHSNGSDPAYDTVSHETAILVLDAALKSTSPNAQLVAAELLCRNARGLDICQSLHWPSSVDGRWNPEFGVKTKVLIVDALTRMAYTGDPSLNALQSLAVRLYGISAGDPDAHVKGCIGMLLAALLPELERCDVRSLMQGPTEVTIADIKAAAAHAEANPDRVFYRIVKDRSRQLSEWAQEARDVVDLRPGALSAAAVSATGPD
jgi:hypothetical protein